MSRTAALAGRAFALLLLAALPALGHADTFAAHALRGMTRVNVAVDGVQADFARYGLTPGEVRAHVEQKLGAAGVQVADDATAEREAGVGQLRVKLTAVASSYAFYSYALALEARRKLALGEGGGFVSQNVWSTGQSGVVNPSDLRNLYAVIDTLLANFIAAHGADNTGTGTP